MSVSFPTLKTGLSTMVTNLRSVSLQPFTLVLISVALYWPAVFCVFAMLFIPELGSPKFQDQEFTGP